MIMAVNVTFSSDESSVSATDSYGSYIIPRPVVVPWSISVLQVTYGITTWYYVNPNGGSDGNSGLSRGSALATLQKFWTSFAAPGKGLICAPGTSQQSCFSNQVSGTAANRIVITCDDVSQGGGLGSVLFQLDQNHGTNGWPGDSQSTSVFNIFNSDYVVLNGLMVQGAVGQSWAPPRASAGNNCGFKWSNGACQSAIAQNCVAYLAGHSGFKDQSANTISATLQGNFSISNGTIDGSGGLDHGVYWPGATPTIIGHIAVNNTGFGINVYTSPTNPLVDRCVTAGNDRQPGGGAGGMNLGFGVTGGLVKHCTFADTAGRSILFQNGVQATVRDCILHPCTNGADTDSITSGITIDHCDCAALLINNPPGWPVPWPFTNNLNPPTAPFNYPVLPCGFDPLYVNSRIYDFRPGFGSPVIGAASDGTNMGAYQQPPVSAPLLISGRRSRAWAEPA